MPPNPHPSPSLHSNRWDHHSLSLVSSAEAGALDAPPPQNLAPHDQFSRTLHWTSLQHREQTPPRLTAAAVLGGHMSEQPPDARGSRSPTVSSCQWPSGPYKA